MRASWITIKDLGLAFLWSATWKESEEGVIIWFEFEKVLSSNNRFGLEEGKIGSKETS